MNGLNDARLTLHGPQLQAEHEARQIVRTPSGLGRWGLYWHRALTRRTLLTLDAQQLRDVGLSAEMARHEGCKPFWRP